MVLGSIVGSDYNCSLPVLLLLVFDSGRIHSNQVHRAIMTCMRIASDLSALCNLPGVACTDYGLSYHACTPRVRVPMSVHIQSSTHAWTYHTFTLMFKEALR